MASPAVRSTIADLLRKQRVQTERIVAVQHPTQEVRAGSSPLWRAGWAGVVHICCSRLDCAGQHLFLPGGWGQQRHGYVGAHSWQRSGGLLSHILRLPSLAC